jgi:hypothetical protein
MLEGHAKDMAMPRHLRPLNHTSAPDQHTNAAAERRRENSSGLGSVPTAQVSR